MEDLGIIYDDDREENSNIQQYTRAVIKTFVVYNRNSLEELRDVLTTINNIHAKKTGRNNSLFVDRLLIRNFLSDIDLTAVRCQDRNIVFW